MPNPNFVYAPPYDPYLSILYYDDDIVVANKPSGLLSVPGRAPAHQDCLISRVNKVFPTATVVHRLDMATSGIMIMAMNKESHRNLSSQFQQRITHKRYFARVNGVVENTSGEVDLPLIVDWPNRPKQKVDYDNGKPSLTRYEVVEQKEDEALMALYPVTGRSHQLRVHMLSLGHPILGDRLYAHPKALEKAPRLQLHAQAISFNHPDSYNWMTFETPIPFSEHTPSPF